MRDIGNSSTVKAELRPTKMGKTAKMGKIARVVTAATVVLALVASSCGGASETESSANDVRIVDAGTINIELPDEIIAVEEDPTAVVDSAAGSESAAGEADPADQDADDSSAPAEPTPEPTEDPDAIPLAEEESGVGDLLDSFEVFNRCLEDASYPLDLVPSGPDDEETLAKLTPDQFDVLFGCASSSQILQTLEDVQAANTDRTAEEIEADNEGTLLFVDCIRGKGWTVDDPVPDADGSLGVGAAGLTPPAGEETLGNPALRECVAEAERRAEEARGN